MLTTLKQMLSGIVDYISHMLLNFAKHELNFTFDCVITNNSGTVVAT